MLAQPFPDAGGQLTLKKITHQRVVVVGDERPSFYVDPDQEMEPA
jgi:hypothetical protein